MNVNKISIICENDGLRHEVTIGTTLGEVSRQICPEVTDPKTGRKSRPLAALVDRQLKELSHPIVMSNIVRFIGYEEPAGRRTYLRSLCMLLQKAVRDLFPEKVLYVEHSLPSGLYCQICEQEPAEDGRRIPYVLSMQELADLQRKMESLVIQDLPIVKSTILVEKAEEIFEANHQPNKADLLRSLGRFFCDINYLGSTADTFYAPLVPSTGYLKVFGLMAYGQGFCLRQPYRQNPELLEEVHAQDKVAATLKEYADWCDVIGIHGVGTLNRSIREGHGIKLINLAEALQERKYAEIADMINERRKSVRFVMIAGPSSSGKTSSSLRLALQCKVLGMNPKVIELDNYFVDRERTPKDENGEYDFEALEAMDLDRLNSDLNKLLSGEEIELPRYDFKDGKSYPSGKRIKLEEKDILIMESIHALDPGMVKSVDPTKIFRVYASALTSLNTDENNNISTSDNRLLRRMVRDNRVRGITPEETIMRWPSVRRGENNNIFPFQENADVLFNSALIFELPMLKYYAEPLLRRILPNSPAYPEAFRLLRFLEHLTALSPAEIDAIPPTSIMREFIGGQTLLV